MYSDGKGFRKRRLKSFSLRKNKTKQKKERKERKKENGEKEKKRNIWVNVRLVLKLSSAAALQQHSILSN